jgi:membrane fusion protein, multidrug efflux system
VVVPMVRIETPSRLRLVVPVPEAYVAGIPAGTRVEFTVPAYPAQIFSAPVARIAESVQVKTRTMPVELDVRNPSGRLAAGMFSEVLWPVRRPGPTLFVPATAVARTTERVFVVRIRDGKAGWVDVKTGARPGDAVEVFGNLQEGDEVASRGTDGLRPAIRSRLGRILQRRNEAFTQPPLRRSTASRESAVRSSCLAVSALAVRMLSIQAC